MSPARKKGRGAPPESGTHRVATPAEPTVPRDFAKEQAEAENIVLAPRGGAVIYHHESLASLADVIMTTLVGTTDEPFERRLLQTIGDELHVLHSGLHGGEIDGSDRSLIQYIYNLSERARGGAELGARLDRAAEAATAAHAAKAEVQS